MGSRRYMTGVEQVFEDCRLAVTRSDVAAPIERFASAL